VLAAAVFAALAPMLARREGGARPPAWLSASLGSLSFAAAYGILYWGETIIPSGLASVLWAVFPMMMAVSGHLFLPGERLRARQGLGFGLGFVGILLLFATDLGDLGPGTRAVGALYLLSPLCSTVGNTLAKRFGERTSSVLLNRAAALGLEREAELVLTGRAVLCIVYLALVGTVLTFGLYFWLLRYAPANLLSLIAYVIPVLALALGWAVGGEPIGAHTLGGTALVLLGVALVVRARALRPAPLDARRGEVVPRAGDGA
jgi:drug/metabolite transporter (DMT)-like permease